MMTPVKMCFKQKILLIWDRYWRESSKWWWWSWSCDWPRSSKSINRNRFSQPRYYKKQQQMSENMLANILGSIMILQNMFILAKFVKFFIVITHAQLVVKEEHGLITQFCCKKIQKKRLHCHKKLSTHLKAILMRTNACMEEALGSAELLSHQGKQQTNELYVTKLIKIVYFLARNNLPVKEMYPKWYNNFYQMKWKWPSG